MHIAFLPILAFIFFLVGHYMGWSQGIDKIHVEAIDRGYALYCPKSGYFAWKDECQK